jgi:hypothetical protein
VPEATGPVVRLPSHRLVGRPPGPCGVVVGVGLTGAGCVEGTLCGSRCGGTEMGISGPGPDGGRMPGFFPGFAIGVYREGPRYGTPPGGGGYADCSATCRATAGGTGVLIASTRWTGSP